MHEIIVDYIAFLSYHMLLLSYILRFFMLLSLGSLASVPQEHQLSIDQKIAKYNLDKKSIEIHIDKTAHTLTLQAGKITLKQYPCVFGGNPTADKKYQGDKCTPEGEFHILAKYPHEAWTRFMLIDYPTKESWAKYQANKASGKIPKGAAIGGSIGIHGVPAHKDYLIDEGINWTLGCISVSNDDIEEIYSYTGVGTKVIIIK